MQVTTYLHYRRNQHSKFMILITPLETLVEIQKGQVNCYYKMMSFFKLCFIETEPHILLVVFDQN